LEHYLRYKPRCGVFKKNRMINCVKRGRMIKKT
jgi:hypothetical protein